MEVCKDYNIEEVIVKKKKRGGCESHMPETINSCWENCAQMLCVRSQDLQQSRKP